MSLPAVVRDRWPELAAWLEALPADPGCQCLQQGGRRRLVVRGQSLVSPVDPRREAERWVESVLPEGAGARVHLIGHGTGWEVAALLARGISALWIHSDELAVLRLALENWDQPDVLADPRLDFASLDACADLARSGDHVLEMPFWKRAFPEACAIRRVALGHLRSAALRLRVLVVEPLYGGSLPMARSAAAALRELGHEVRSVDFTAMAQAREALHEFSDRHPGASTLAGEFTRMLGRMLLVEARAFRPDLVLGLAQSPFTPECAATLREGGVRTAFWFVEDFETLDYWKGLHGAFDLFLTIQRGRFHRELAALSSSPVAYLPACADPAQCHPEPWGDGRPPDLSFVGAGYFNRERFFLELLDLPLRIWGSEWRAQGPLRPLVQNSGQRTTPDLNRRIFSNSRINLNLHSSSYHAGIHPQGDFVNPRTFEILACGGFQLVDRRSLLEEVLQPGRDLLCYESVQELRQQIAHHLEHDEERRQIAAQGYRTVQARHTYRHRMAELLELMLLQGDPFPRAARRQSLSETGGDRELQTWLESLPAEIPHELDAVADWLRQRQSPLDETGAALLYMQELRDWARERGVERMMEQARHG
jgi:spore maturation protein CgeB